MAMREIKFRAWDKENNRMSKPLDIINKSTFVTAFDFGDMERHICLFGFNKDTMELMQYTGLKDKNGVEIYEGDIVKYKLTERLDDESIETNSVEFIGGSFYPLPVNDICDDDWYSRIISEYEVIGNIYENKELLDK